MQTRSTRCVWPDYALIAFSVGLWVAALILSRHVMRIDHVPDRILVVVDSRFALLLPAGVILFILLSVRRSRMQHSAMRRALGCGQCLALAVPGVLFALYGWYPTATANLLYLAVPLPAAVLAVTLIYEKNVAGTTVVAWDWFAATIVFTGLFWWMGLYFTESVGQHSGDEVHYIAQAESLYHDGDLDLRNVFDDPSTDLNDVHISRNSLHGKWYSWHPPGLSFLIAPTVGAGIFWRHAVLGAIAGLAVAGIYALGRTWGADRRSAWAATALLALGPFWCVYASRALPEVLGAALAVYSMLAVFLQQRHPWKSAVLSAVCIAYLPWAHTRFIPVAVTLVGCYGLQGLLGQETWRRKTLRLGLYSALCLGGLGAYQLVQLRMFENGLAYPVPHLLLSRVSGLWHSLASSRGILYMLPLFACALAAAVMVSARRRTRMAGIYTLLVFLSVWLSACGTRWFTGGACMPGRFLLVVTPLVTACLAVALSRAGAGFRLLAFYVGVFPAALFVVEMSVLEQCGKAFCTPLVLDVVHPVFTGLLRFYYAPDKTTAILPASFLYAVALLLLVMPRARRAVQASLLALLVAGFAASAQLLPRNTPQTNPRTGAKFFQGRDTDRVLVLGVRNRAAEPALLTDFFDRFYEAAIEEIMSVTSRDLGALTSENWISEPYLTPNDWDGRGYRWATLVAPFRAGNGKRALRIEADNTGRADVEFVIREGARNRAERRVAAGASLRETVTFTAEDRGDLYVLARFTGSGGEFTVHRIAYTGYKDELLEKAGLVLAVP